MSIHLGEFVQKTVEAKRLTYREFGALIHKNEKTIPDIYDRAAMSTDLLLTISKALNTDFFALFYTEEPLKSLRSDAIADLNKQIQLLKEQLQKTQVENNIVKKELSLTQELVIYLKETLAFAKEQIELYKVKLAGVNPV